MSQRPGPFISTISSPSSRPSSVRLAWRRPQSAPTSIAPPISFGGSKPITHPRGPKR